MLYVLFCLKFTNSFDSRDVSVLICFVCCESTCSVWPQIIQMACHASRFGKAFQNLRPSASSPGGLPNSDVASYCEKLAIKESNHYLQYRF